MRTVREFIKDVVQKPPLLFSLAALFHLLGTIYTFGTTISAPFPSYEWLRVLWMVLYTISWLFICDLRRWAAWVYLGLASINIIIMLLVKPASMRELLSSNLFPIDILFCFFILFYYKRFK